MTMQERRSLKGAPLLDRPLMTYDLYSQSFKRNPYPTYDDMRQADPIFKNPGMSGHPIWFVTSYDLGVEVLRDHKRFIKRWQNTLTEEELAQQQVHPLSAMLDDHLLNLDPPDHTRIRSLVNKVFTGRRVERLRPRIQQIADDLIDDMLTQDEADLIEAFAFPLPITVIAELLGVPSSDRDKFRVWSNAAIQPTLTEEEWQHTVPLLMEFMTYLSDMFRERKRAPREDLISDLLAVEEAGDSLSMNELYAMIFLLLVAGHETTVNLIANGTLALLQHPEQLAQLKANPSQMAQAVEELLRYDAPVERSLTRFVAEDMQFHGAELKKGELVIVVLGAANRDPAHFDCPAHLDINREPKQNKHLSFGMGIHYCLGAPLARAEGEIALNTLLSRLPNLRLNAPVDTLVWRENPIIRGVEQLPVAWDI